MHALAETGDHDRLTKVLKSMPPGTFEPDDAAKTGFGTTLPTDPTPAGSAVVPGQKRKKVRVLR